MPQPTPTLPGAVSSLSADVVRGPVRQAVVLGAHGVAAYLAVEGRVLPVLGRGAVPLPTGVLVGGSLEGACAAGDVALVGDGLVRMPGATVRITRTRRPARVRRVGASAVASPALPVLDAAVHDGGLAAAASTVAVAAAGAAAGAPDAAVRSLVGRGAGLTPSGDDALAGLLLVAHATGSLPGLAPAVRARLAATTAVSGALLDAAADGYAAPAVVTIVDAVLDGDAAATAAALLAVLAIGHTSGRDLVTGVAAAVRHLVPTGRTAA